MGGSGGVAGPAADDQRAIGAAAACDLAYMVGGEVGRGVGGSTLPPGAPVAHHGTMVCDDSSSAFALVGSAWRSGRRALAQLLARSWRRWQSIHLGLPRSRVRQSRQARRRGRVIGAAAAALAQLVPAGRAARSPAAAEEGEEDRGGARGCASSTHADHPGACLGQANTLTTAIWSSSALVLVTRWRSADHRLPRAPRRNRCASPAVCRRGPGQDLVPKHGVRHLPGAPGGSARSSSRPSRRWAGCRRLGWVVVRASGRARCRPGRRARRSRDEAALVDHAGRDAPRGGAGRVRPSLLSRIARELVTWRVDHATALRLVVDTRDGPQVLQLADLASELPAGPDRGLVGLAAGEQVRSHQGGGVGLHGGRGGQQRRQRPRRRRPR